MIRSHGYSSNGFFGLNLGRNSYDNYSTGGIDDLYKKLNNGKVKLCGSIIFMGCDTQGLASYYTNTTGKAAVGSDGFTGPKNSQSMFRSTGIFFLNYKMGATQKKINLGNKYNINMR